MKKIRIAAGCAGAAALVSLLNVVPAHALNAFDNSLPYQTGCAQDALPGPPRRSTAARSA